MDGLERFQPTAASAPFELIGATSIQRYGGLNSMRSSPTRAAQVGDSPRVVLGRWR
jgi:hypothetical protein